MQSKKMSLVEAITNVIIGYVVNVIAQFVIWPMFGIEASVQAHFIVAAIFTGVSLSRSYILRRIFNRIN